jgi:hypothetical protein
MPSTFAYTASTSAKATADKTVDKTADKTADRRIDRIARSNAQFQVSNLTLELSNFSTSSPSLLMPRLCDIFWLYQKFSSQRSFCRVYKKSLFEANRTVFG